jgi:hypothetical protein
VRNFADYGANRCREFHFVRPILWPYWKAVLLSMRCLLVETRPARHTRRAFEKYCTENPERGGRAQTLVVANAAAAHQRRGEYKPSLTHCKHGHSLSECTYYFTRGRICRKCKICAARN